MDSNSYIYNQNFNNFKKTSKYKIILLIFLLSLFSCSFLPEKESPVVRNPGFNIAGGIYYDAVTVRISCRTDGAKIIYTADGTTPSKNNGSFYSDPITINKTTSIKAIAVKELWESSDVTVQTYTIIGEIAVKHGTQIIPDVTGQYTVVANTTGTTIETTFTIENRGNTSITIEDITLDSTSDYYSIIDPLVLTIPGGLNISFTIRYTPLEYGTTAADITISSDDIDNSAYSFLINGIALESSGNAEIDVAIDAVNIESGNYTYDFGSVNIGEQKESGSFIIHNNGTSYLQLASPPSIQLLGIDANNFNVIQPQNTIIQPGGTEIFKIQFIPVKESAITADVIIANNDSSEFLFTFTITGESNDVTPPSLSSNVITASKITCRNVTLSWTLAADDITAQSKLRYLAYYSTSLLMNSVEEIENHGTAFGSYAENISTINITGLNLSTGYYFNVIVMDEAGNKACYQMKNQRTRDKAYMAIDINTTGNSAPSDLIIFNGLLYFTADNGSNGRELWHFDSVSDSAGFIDIKTGGEGSNPGYPAEFNGKIYFNADGDSNGRELWSYNGINTPSLVYNINSGSNHGDPKFLTAFNGKLYFNATTSAVGSELWSYDGTNNPGLVYDIYSGTGSGNPEYITVNNDKIFFSSVTTAYGNELWNYDGINTPALTDDLNSGDKSGNPKFMTLFNNVLYYNAVKNKGIELFSYNGSASALVNDINASGDSNPSDFAVFNGKLYFSATDGSSYGRELWEYDGVSEPLRKSDINPAGDSNPSYLTVFNGKLYFSATDGVNGLELWEYDGTNSPSMVYNINTVGEGNPKNFTAYNGNLYFSAADNISGIELWKLEP